MEQEKESALWHRVSEQEKARIKEQAKEILDNFAKALEKADTEKKNFFVSQNSTKKEQEFSDDSKAEGIVERESSWREETAVEQAEKEFREIMFQNAPSVERNCIKAEKKKW